MALTEASKQAVTEAAQALGNPYRITFDDPEENFARCFLPDGNLYMGFYCPPDQSLARQWVTDRLLKKVAK
jgi:hypothetical protein